MNEANIFLVDKYGKLFENAIFYNKKGRKVVYDNDENGVYFPLNATAFCRQRKFALTLPFTFKAAHCMKRNKAVQGISMVSVRIIFYILIDRVYEYRICLCLESYTFRKVI